VADLLVLEDGLTFESGAHVAPLEIAYATYGDPAHPAIYISHALTGDAEAADWWGTLIGPGKPVDTERFHVICGNILGGCKGTTGPSSTNPATGERYGLAFPLFTIRDMVAVHRRLLRELGVTTLVCATARLTAGNIAFSKVARHAILTHDAMDVARMMAHITYVSEESLRRKFDRNRRGEAMTMASDFEVEHYLDHQARIFLERFDPHSYLYLSRVMDYYEPFAEDNATPSSRFELISFDSDWRFGTEHSEFILAQLTALGADVRHHEVQSPWGHDSFLMHVPEYHRLVYQALE
jgi:homoserine O-acetyltransferase/O-succinyltransferase